MTVNGKTDFVPYYKTTSVAQVAGTWTNLGVFAGNPIANTYAGTSLTYVPTDDTTEGAVYHGGNVASATKHFLGVGASVFAAAGAPWCMMCVDQLGYVPITGADVTGTGVRTVTMTALGAGARYPYGEGCRAYFSTEVAPTAGGPNLSSFVYTNSNSTPATGKTVPVTVGFYATPVAGAVPHSGNAANRYGPFLPLASGDTGIADFETFQLSGGTAYTGTGQLVLHLVKPLWTLHLPANGMFSERDLVNQFPSMPRIKDGAHLNFMLFNTGATTTTAPIFVSFTYGYGG